MKWHAITGSWRTTNEKVEKDVERTVKKIIFFEDGIVTGGALGVDYFATQTVLDNLDEESVGKQLKIYLPLKMEDYCRHYYGRAEEGVITKRHAEILEDQLNEIHEINPGIIFDESPYTKVDKESYYARIVKIIEASDDVYAFHVNESEGVQYGIDLARKSGKPIHIKKYKIPLE